MADEPDAPRGVAAHLKGAMVGAVHATAEHIDERKKAHVAGVLEQFEADLAPLIQEHVQLALDNPAMPDHLRALLEETGAPTHFSGSLLIGVAVGAIIGPVLGSAVEPFVQDISNAAWNTRPTRPLTPDLLAAAVLKGVMDLGAASAEANLSGISDGRFNAMVNTAGQSLGIAEALLLYRRQQITLGHLQEIVKYSNVNPKFYADVEKLQYGTPTVGEAVGGALKGHLTDAQAAEMVGHAGVDPANFGWLKATAGRPVSLMEALDLWNRGEITEARVDEIIRQSDINDQFAPDAKLLRVYFPPVRSVVPMLRSGSIDEATARDLLAKQGVPANIADAFVKEAHHTSSTSVKTLTESQIVRMFVARFITRAEALTRLEAIKYTAADANTLLDFADEARHEQQLNATIRKVGTRYVAYKLSKTDAIHALSQASVPGAAQNDLFSLWDIERDANVHVPTPAAVMHVYRQGNMTAANARTRLIELGVGRDDLGIVIMGAYAPNKGEDAAAAALAIEFA